MICVNFVVKIKRFRAATQIHILKVNMDAFSIPSIVTWIISGPKLTCVTVDPGVMKSKGEAMAAAKTGMNRVTLFKKYSKGILESVESEMTMTNNASRE
jgi:hypothetical protein